MKRKYPPVVAGQRYDRLEILSVTPRSHKCVARCDCGAVREFWVGNIKRGSTGSCGCAQGERQPRTVTTSVEVERSAAAMRLEAALRGLRVPAEMDDNDGRGPY